MSRGNFAVFAFFCAFLTLSFHGRAFADEAKTGEHAPGFPRGLGDADVVSGRPTAQADWAIALYDRAKDSLCSGMVMEGCVLTAGHCVPDDARPEVFKGLNPDLKKESASLTGPVIRLGDGKTPERDIAVVKLNRPLRPWITRDQLATERIDVPTDPVNVKPGEVIAYGNSHTLERVNPESKKIELFDTGSGVKRRGIVAIQGYGTADDRLARFGRGISKKGDVLWVGRGPSIVAQGDSGAYLFVDGKIHGILSAITGPTLDTTKDDHPRKADVMAAEVTAAAFSPIPDNRAKIIEALDKLGCRQNTPEALYGRLQTLMDRFGEKLADPSQLPDADRRELEAIMRQNANIPPRDPISVRAVVRAGKITFTTTRFFGGEPFTTPELPLRRGG